MDARQFVDMMNDAMEEELRPGETDERLLTMDGYDDCIVGIVQRFNDHPYVVYDRRKVLAKLQEQGMTLKEALEYHEFNQVGAWVGKSTPGFIDMPPSEDA